MKEAVSKWVNTMAARQVTSRWLYLVLRIACHSALVGQEPEPSQATDMALACCFLGQVLRVGCYYFPPFAARSLHVCTIREMLVAKGGTMGENTVR